MDFPKNFELIILFCEFQSYVKEGMSLYKATLEVSKRLHVSTPTLYAFLKEYAAHGNVVDAPKFKDKKDFFDKLTDYQRDIIRNIMHEELRKSTVKKKLSNSTKKTQFFALANVHAVISQNQDLPQ